MAELDRPVRPEGAPGFAEAVAAWRLTRLTADHDRIPPRRERFRTLSGFEIRDLYTPLDIANIDPLADIGLPGVYPFTRGVRASTYRGRPWTIRQVAGFGRAEDTNARYKYLLAQGTTGLSVAFDLPTQIGIDSDNPLAAGEVGKVGVAIDSLEDMLRLFEDIPLDSV